MKKILFYIVVAGLAVCQTVQDQPKKTVSQRKMAPMGPVTQEVDLTGQTVYYVSLLSEKTGDGTREKPFHTISGALRSSGNEDTVAVLVAGGVYEEYDLTVKKGVHLYGGYSPDFKERDVEKYVTTVNAMGKGRIFTLAGNNVIDGFQLLKGRVSGKGAAVYTTATDIVITNNVFYGNKTLKPEPWSPEFMHETANDGGAIYCADSAELLVQNNYFFRNMTENGRGGAIAADNNCVLLIENNVFMDNVIGTDDPMRSSDGGAVSIFRWSDAEVTNNWFLNNQALNKNDGGGLWIALWSSAKVKDNIFVGNVAGDDAGAIFVGGQEHRYDAPLDPIPPKDKFFISITDNVLMGNLNLSFNSGAMRFTMEARGEFVDNVTAFNNGIYFQRSEVLIEKNIIFDDFLLVETKEGLKPCIVKDNVIWADYKQGEGINPEVKDNNMLSPADGNYSRPVHFINDALTSTIAGVNYNSRKNITRFVLLEDKFDEGALTGRVVKVGDKWSVVKYNKGRVMEVWGDFVLATDVRIMPTYSPNTNM